jgi:hypothetical protein
MHDQSISESLVVALKVVVLDVFTEDPPQMAFAERDHLGHTF